MNDTPSKRDMETTKRVMGVLVNMPPKHHDEMKIGKPKRKPKKNSPARKAKN